MGVLAAARSNAIALLFSSPSRWFTVGNSLACSSGSFVAIGPFIRLVRVRRVRAKSAVQVPRAVLPWLLELIPAVRVILLLL